MKRKARKSNGDKILKHFLGSVGGLKRSRVLFVAAFVIIGVAALLYARAETPVAKLEAETFNSSDKVTVVADSAASGGKYIQFGDGAATPPPPPPPDGMPSKQSIIDGAGPKASTSTSRGSFTVTSSGTYTNFNASRLYVKANNVTVRNCRIVGNDKYTVQLVNGYSNLTIEDCYIENTSTADSTAITETGANIIVRRSTVIGLNGDAIKIAPGSLYEYNHVKVSKVGGSSAHADTFQSQAKGDWTARYNVMDLPAQTGGNIGLFQQSWNGSLGKCLNISNIDWMYNYIRGGNHGIYVEAYKSGSCSPGKYISNMRIIGNRLADGPKDGVIWRHSYCSIDAVNVANITISDNRFESGAVAPGCGS